MKRPMFPLILKTTAAVDGRIGDASSVFVRRGAVSRPKQFSGRHAKALVAVSTVFSRVAVCDDGGVQSPGADDGAVDHAFTCGVSLQGFGGAAFVDEEDGAGGECRCECGERARVAAVESTETESAVAA